MKEKIFLLIVALLVLSIANTVQISQVYATRTIEGAVEEGLAYLERHYNQISETRSVCMDAPAIPIRIQRSDGEWSIIGKLTGENYESNPHPYDDICGGGKVTLLDMEQQQDTYLFSFDINGDGAYGDVEITATYQVLPNANMTLNGTVTQYVNKGYTCDVWIDLTKVLDDIAEDNEFSISQYKGWASGRYVNRHVTKMLGELYNYMILEELYDWETFDDEERVTKLVDHFYDAGYEYDFYDAMFKKSNDGRPDYPSDVTTDTSPTKYGWLVTNNTYPDPEMWANNPVYCDSYHFAYPYSSRLVYDYAREYFLNSYDMFLSDGGVYPVVEDSYGSNFGSCFLTELQWSIHLMHKYGDAYPYNSQAKTYIQEVLWDTWGIRAEKIAGIYDQTTSNTFTIVPLATYLSALVAYYDATGDNCYLSNGSDDAYLLDRADKIAGMLLALQVKWGDWIHAKDDIWINKPDHIGGFLSAYGLGSYTFDNAHGQGFFANTIYSFLDFMGYYHRDPEMTGAITPTNTESTIPILMALMYYEQELDRTPDSWEPENILPNMNAEVWIDVDGGYHAVGTTLPNGLVFSDIRTDEYHDTAYYETKWTWTKELPGDVDDFNFTAKFEYKGSFYGDNEVYLAIYVYKSGNLRFTYHEKFIEDFSGDEDGVLVLIPDSLVSLEAGTYQFQVHLAQYVYSSTDSVIDWESGSNYGYLTYFGYNADDWFWI